LSPTSGNVGDTVNVTGSGFNASATVTIYFDTSSVRTVTAASSGGFTTTFTVPDSYKGTHTVKGTDASGDSPGVSFTTSQKITINPTSGAVGDTVTVSGTGFAANSNVSFFFDDASVGTTPTSNGNGTFSGTFSVPATSRGSHTVKAQDASANAATATFSVSVKLTVSPTSGAVGDTVTVGGTGFAANSNVSFFFDDAAIGTATSTNSGGTFTGSSFTIPPTTRGGHTVKAQDASANAATATFSVSQKITISPTSGTSGSTVNVTGTGFGANKTITITYNGAAVGTTPAALTTDDKGSFSGSFAVPSGLAGTYTVQVSDGSNTASASFTSTTNATISQTTTEAAPGWVGMQLTITGNGFKANATVTVTYTTDPVTLATVATDASGNFSVNITIPASAGGVHTITVTDGYTSKEFTFVMESTPPPTPQPLLPLMGDKAKSRAYFDWEDVDDPSKPVTYDLQVATDDDFETLLVEESGLTSSEFTLEETQKLKSTKKEAPYYWRVRAIDSADNASDWTGAGTFYVGFVFPEIEGWVLYGLLAADAVLFFLLGLWAGRRRSSY